MYSSASDPSNAVTTTDTLSIFGISQTSRVLVVMPHPDDEAIFAGGFLHKLTANHVAVKVITMTVGEKSTLRWGLSPADNLADVRQTELTRSFRQLGVADYHIYHYEDGGIENLRGKIQTTVRQNIKTFDPTHVATLEPDGVYGHPDHVALSSFVTRVVSKPMQLLYITVSPTYHLPKAVWMAKKKIIKPIHPDIELKLAPTDIVAKLKSLRAHRSQFVSPVYRLPFEAVFFLRNKLLTREYFAKGN